MLRNHLISAWRHFNRNRGFWLLNVGGLALGLACCLLIGLFIADELSYDRYHSNSDRIYRVTTGLGSESGDRLASTVYALKPAIDEEVTGVEAAVRIYGSQLSSTLVEYGETRLNVNGVYHADAEVFRIFDFPLLSGNPETALQRPNTLVLSRSAARTLFGSGEAMGKSVTIGSRDYEVTGVMEDVPGNSHFRFDYLTSFATVAGQSHFLEHGWTLLGFYTYVLLDEQAEPTPVMRQINGLGAEADRAGENQYALQPLTDIHLRSSLSGEIQAKSDIRYIYLFGTVALLVLLIACVNYVNLTTAMARQRRRQVGVRKALGARDRQMFWQFITESVMVSLAALAVALLMVESTLPWFNQLTQKSLTLGSGGWTVLLPLAALGVGLLAGGYPALRFARVRPLDALRGGGAGSGRAEGVWMRKALVVFQFTVSIALIIATLTVQRQLDFVQRERLGFDKENLMVLHKTEKVGDRYGSLKQSLLAESSVRGVTTSTNVPGQQLYMEYRMNAPDGSEREHFSLTFNTVDGDFVETMGLELAAGRDLDAERAADRDGAILVNEAAVRTLGWEDPLSQTLFNRQVVGVVRDYLTLSAGVPVQAASYILGDGPQRFMAVRVAEGDLRTAAEAVESTWEMHVPEAPLEFTFADSDIEALYRSEQRLGRVFLAFSLLAIIVACLGLLGLAAYSAVQRTREIGIRKVLGASAADILALLNREYLSMVLVGFVIGSPVAWYAMGRWLEDFAYRINPGLELVLLAGGAALLIALLTVSWTSLRAARENPVDSLRSE